MSIRLASHAFDIRLSSFKIFPCPTHSFAVLYSLFIYYLSIHHMIIYTWKLWRCWKGKNDTCNSVTESKENNVEKYVQMFSNICDNEVKMILYGINNFEHTYTNLQDLTFYSQYLLEKFASKILLWERILK